MKQWQRIISVCAAIAGLGLLAPAAAGAKDLVLNGDAKCTACHNESSTPDLLAIGKTKHGNRADGRTPTCTSCHGASEKHLSGGGKPDITFGKKSASTAEEKDGTCLTCHQGGKRINWMGSAHANNDVTCSSCHSVHGKKDRTRDKVTQSEVCFTCHKQQRAETMRSSTHPIKAGGVACSDCHNPHGSTGPKLLVKNTTNETCWSCHAEKRGPFLWEHPPASDDCMNCHSPHGSNQAALLKFRQPYLCSSCHIAGGHSGTGIRSGNDLGSGVVPGAAATAASQMVGLSCTNCHTEVHGSNHPSGARFAR